jgi:ferritin-like metal-binding protein YciE
MWAIRLRRRHLEKKYTLPGPVGETQHRAPPGTRDKLEAGEMVMKTETLQDMYLKELRDLYGSEKLLMKWLPKLIDKARLPELRRALTQHLAETGNHVSRLEQIFRTHGQNPAAKTCRGLKGILREADDDLAVDATPFVVDAAIVAAAEQIEHYELAAYGTLQSYAIHLGYDEAVRLLQKTLDEERAADKSFTEIALSHMHAEAA